MSNKLKEPAVLISGATAVGVCVASYYFFNRLALMQEQMDAMNAKISQQDDRLLSVDQRMVGIMHRTAKSEKKLGKVETKVGTLVDAVPYPAEKYSVEKSTPKAKSTKKSNPKKKVQEYHSDEEEDDLVSAFK